MKRDSYPEQDYVFGQIMLTLRSAIGLTQAGLAALLEVSRQSVADWEAGRKYPKVNHLQAFVGLAFQKEAFPTGREGDEIRTLGKAANQKVLLDEFWLDKLLAQPPKEKIVLTNHRTSAHGIRLHWADALAADKFYGREWELMLLREWVVEKRCRVVTLLGMGGIGKSALAVNLMHQLADHFEIVIWRSLRDIPTCDQLLTDLLQVLVPQVLGEVHASFERRQSFLVQYLRNTQVRLVLDNLESVLEEGGGIRRMRTGYEDV